METKLDLGCGDGKISPEHIGIDINPKAKPDYLCNLLKFPWSIHRPRGEALVEGMPVGEGYSIEKSSVDEVYCSHFIEHIPAVTVDGYNINQYRGTRMNNFDISMMGKDLMVLFFEEIYHVMKPGGILKLRWPSPTAEPAFQDPTHRRFISRHFLAYLNAAWRKEMVSHCDWNMDFQILRDKVMMDERIAKHKDGSRFAHYHFNAIVAIEAELQVVKPMRT